MLGDRLQHPYADGMHLQRILRAGNVRYHVRFNARNDLWSDLRRQLLE
jgi:hypothetical protein